MRSNCTTIDDKGGWGWGWGSVTVGAGKKNGLNRFKIFQKTGHNNNSGHRELRTWCRIHCQMAMYVVGNSTSRVMGFLSVWDSADGMSSALTIAVVVVAAVTSYKDYDDDDDSDNTVKLRVHVKPGITSSCWIQ